MMSESIAKHSWQGPHQDFGSIQPKSVSSENVSQISEDRRLIAEKLEEPGGYDLNDLFKSAVIIRKRPKQPSSLLNNQNFLQKLRQKNLIRRFVENLHTKSYVLQQPLTEIQQFVLKENYIKMAESVQQEEKSNYILKKDMVMQLIGNFAIPIFQPDNVFLIIWDILIVLFLLYTMWIGAFMLAFYSDANPQSIASYNMYLSVLFMFTDLLINCNRAIIQQGEVLFIKIKIIRDRHIIIKQYIEKSFSQSFLNLLNWIIMLINFNHDGFNEILGVLMIIMTVRRIQYFYIVYYDQIYLKGSIIEAFDLLILILSIYLFAHFTACIWHYTAIKSAYLGTNWLMAKGCADAGIGIRYNYSFYFSTMTMVTVGYGDITPQNFLETIVSSAIMFVSTIVFAYSMNSIGILLKNINDEKQNYRRYLVLINAYMKTNQVNFNIQSRIRNYMKFYTDADNTSKEDVNKVIQLLPQMMQKELNTEIQMKAMRHIRLIVDNFSKQTQLDLSDYIEELQFTPGEFIYHNGDRQNQSLYYIIKGEVRIMEEISQKQLQIMTKGEEFGQYQFITGYKTKTAAQSVGFTSVYKIQRENFIKIIQLSQRDFEKFHNIKDNAILNEDYSVLNLKCNLCGRCTHMNINCPLITYKPDWEQRVQTTHFLSQKRDKKYRRLKKRALNTLNDLEQIQTKVTEYRLEVLHQSLRSEQNSFTSSSENSEDCSEDKSAQEQVSQPVKKNASSLAAIQMQQDSFSKTPLIPANTRQSKARLSVTKHRTSKEELLNRQTRVAIKSESNLILKTLLQKVSMDFEMPLQFHYISIDALWTYRQYMTHNNINNILTKMNNKKTRKQPMISSNIYTFFDEVRKKAYLIRQHFQSKRSKSFSVRKTLKRGREQSNSKR